MTPRPHGSVEGQREWTIRNEPFQSGGENDPALQRVQGPPTKGWVRVVEAPVSPPERVQELEAVLGEARPYVFNRTQGDDWRAETARELLERVDAALRGSVPAGEDDDG